MLDKYYLRCKEVSEPIGILTVDIENDHFGFEENDAYEGQLPTFLAYPDAPMPIDRKIKMWVLGRAPEPNYALIESLIKKAGLSSYDAYGFFKYNKGQFIPDKFYVEVID